MFLGLPCFKRGGNASHKRNALQIAEFHVPTGLGEGRQRGLFLSLSAQRGSWPWRRPGLLVLGEGGSRRVSLGWDCPSATLPGGTSRAGRSTPGLAQDPRR